MGRTLYICPASFIAAPFNRLWKFCINNKKKFNNNHLTEQRFVWCQDYFGVYQNSVVYVTRKYVVGIWWFLQGRGGWAKSALSMHVSRKPVSHRRDIRPWPYPYTFITCPCRDHISQDHTWDHVSSANFDRPSILVCYDNRINALNIVKPKCDGRGHVSRQFRFIATIKHQTLLTCTLFIYVFTYIYKVYNESGCSWVCVCVRDVHNGIRRHYKTARKSRGGTRRPRV